MTLSMSKPFISLTSIPFPWITDHRDALLLPTAHMPAASALPGRTNSGQHCPAPWGQLLPSSWAHHAPWTAQSLHTQGHHTPWASPLSPATQLCAADDQELIIKHRACSVATTPCTDMLWQLSTRLLPLCITHAGAGEVEEAKTRDPFVACPDRHPIDSSMSHWQSPLYHSGTAATMPRIPRRLASPRGATREAPVSAKNLMVVWQVYKS